MRNAGAANDENRLEQEDLAFHRRVREGYLKIHRLEPQRVLLVDGRRTADEVSAEIWSLAEGRLAARGIR